MTSTRAGAVRSASAAGSGPAAPRSSRPPGRDRDCRRPAAARRPSRVRAPCPRRTGRPRRPRRDAARRAAPGRRRARPAGRSRALPRSAAPAAPRAAARRSACSRRCAGRRSRGSARRSSVPIHMSGPLDGLIVADFSRVLAGPYASMLLGDLGADVIKIERPGTGDDTRAWGPPWRDGVSTYFLGLNRNKRSVVLDLADEGDRELARRLGERADVLLESFRPGLMASWGLDGDALRAANPRIVSCSVTAFGSGEAASGLPGYDFLLQAMGGLMSVTGEPDR